MKTLIAALIVVGGLGRGVGRADDLEPNVRLRPDGVVERFDWGEFRYVPTGSRFVPVRPRRLNTALMMALPVQARRKAVFTAPVRPEKRKPEIFDARRPKRLHR